jgi:YD repeat-containing protein
MIVLMGQSINTASATSYVYDELDRVITATDLTGNQTHFAYDASGNIIGISYTDVENLMKNGSFEEESLPGIADEWNYFASSGGNAIMQLTSSPVYAGSWAQQLSVSDYDDPWQVAMISQTMDASDIEHYSLEFNLYNKDLDGARVLILLEFIDDASNVFESHEYDISHTSERFLPYKIQGWFPDGTDRLKVGFLLQTTVSEGIGNVYIDNVRFYEPRIINLIENGGFERYTGSSGVADAWDYYASPGSGIATFEVNGKFRNEGIAAQKISGENFLQWELGMISQTVDLPSSQFVTYFSDVYVRELNDARVLVRVEFYDSSSSYLDSLETIMDYTTNSFVPVMESGNIPAGAVQAKLMIALQATSVGGNGTIFVDRAGIQLPDEWNRIHNGSFERFANRNSAADDWDYYVSPGGGTAMFRVVGGPVADSKRAQRIDVAGLDQWELAMISQFVDIGSEETFKLAYKINTRQLEDARVLALLEFYDQNNQYITSLEEAHTETTTGYKSYVWEDEIPIGASKVKVAFALQSVQSEGAGIFYIDDVQFLLN